MIRSLLDIYGFFCWWIKIEPYLFRPNQTLRHLEKWAHNLNGGSMQCDRMDRLFLIFFHFQQWELAQQHIKLVIVSSKLCQIPNWTLSKWPKKIMFRFSGEISPNLVTLATWAMLANYRDILKVFLHLWVIKVKCVSKVWVCFGPTRVEDSGGY